MFGCLGLKLCYVRITQVCILLQMIHPALEELAAPVESFQISCCGRWTTHIAEIEIEANGKVILLTDQPSPSLLSRIDGAWVSSLPLHI